MTGVRPGARGAATPVLVALDQDVRRPWAVVLLLVTTVLVAAPLGAVVGARAAA